MLTGVQNIAIELLSGKSHFIVADDKPNWRVQYVESLVAAMDHREQLLAKLNQLNPDYPERDET